MIGAGLAPGFLATADYLAVRRYRWNNFIQPVSSYKEAGKAISSESRTGINSEGRSLDETDIGFKPFRCYRNKLVIFKKCFSLPSLPDKSQRQNEQVPYQKDRKDKA